MQNQQLQPAQNSQNQNEVVENLGSINIDVVSTENKLSLEPDMRENSTKDPMINKFSFSIIWFQGTQVSDFTSVSKILDYLSDEYSLLDHLDGRSIEKNDFQLEPPWKKFTHRLDKQPYDFWMRYLGVTNHKYIPGERAVNQLVPMMRKIFKTKKTELKYHPDILQVIFEPEIRTELREFFYSFGFGVVLTLFYDKEISISDLSKQLNNISNGNLGRRIDKNAWKIKLQIEDDSRYIKLDDLGKRIARILEAEFFGKEWKNHLNSPVENRGVEGLQTFSFLTVTQGTYCNQENHDAILSGLFPITNWPEQNNDWQFGKSEDNIIPQKNQNESIFIGQARSRALWFPMHQQANARHENLVMATLQVEALSAVLRWADAELERGAALEGRLNVWARVAADQLTKMYQGSSMTYQSESLARQIRDAGMIPIIKRVSQYFPSLSLEAKPAEK
jgi:hypothetical protein